MPDGRRRVLEFWRRMSLRCVPQEVDRGVKSFKIAMDTGSQDGLRMGGGNEEEVVVRGGGARGGSTGRLPKLSSIEDDKRLKVPALEERVKMAERTLVQVHSLQYTMPSAGGGVRHADDGGGGTSFAPLSVVEPQRLNSGWGWLLGQEGGRRKSIRHLLHKRVIEVRLLRFMQ